MGGDSTQSRNAVEQLEQLIGISLSDDAKRLVEQTMMAAFQQGAHLTSLTVDLAWQQTLRDGQFGGAITRAAVTSGAEPGRKTIEGADRK